ncbi:hypothetical protein BSKO_07114 [Bryopsis sp. KO-2023]|nr:hypothetical protein BSKO_07114 [Bryopsis sp. KO-2023]
MPVADEFLKGAEIIPDQLYFVYLRRLEQARTSRIAAANICFSIDNELIYEPFCADFGPLNLGQTYRFCHKLRQLLQIAKRQHQKVFFYCSSNEHFKANAAVLAGAFQIIYLDRSAEEAYKPLRQYEPYPAFRDASCLPPTFILTVFHCLQGVQKAKEVGFIDWNLDPAAFNVEEYEAFERVEGGDLNWIVPRKLLAFAGPSAKRMEAYGYRTHIPEDYVKYFKSKGVSAIVRLNKKVYDRRRFTTSGFNHHELFFPDGSCPPVSIVKEFLRICDQEAGAMAVHCKAGLGRTGVLICCYMMRTFRFTAEEALGYIRICRPGSVIGPQQNFIKEMQPFAWKRGSLERTVSLID